MKGKGVYGLHCPCHPKSLYVGQTSRSFEMRSNEHKKATEKGNWSHSGLTQHKQNCDAPIDWENPEILSRAFNKNKDRLKYDLRVEEALWIRRSDCGPNRGLNEDWGAHAKTQSWMPVFNTME